MQLAERIEALGSLASKRQLAVLGFGRYVIDQAIADGRLIPVRPGWVATGAANQLAVIAVLHGARLTGATSLRSFGVWAGSDYRLHLQLPPNAHRVDQCPLTPIEHFTPPKFTPRGVIRHWTLAESAPVAHPAWRVPIVDAIVAFSRDEPAEQVAATLESAVHRGRMSRADVATLFTRLPRRLRRLARRLNFLAESGLETIGRLGLENEGYVVVQQVQIGPDRVDVVIDGWLVIEFDGDEWHDPVEDRKRTNRLIRAGYRVLRFGSADVLDRWDECLATIREVHSGVIGRSAVGFLA